MALYAISVSDKGVKLWQFATSKAPLNASKKQNYASD